MGDRIRVKIITKDGFRIRKRKGGDRLEVRIVNARLKASTAGHVVDYDNGVYMAIVDALWPGKHTITITLTFRRELITAVYAAQYKVR